jgi:Flp pilus assembly protein TadG
MSLRRRERGAAAVEFALVVPILLMLLFGVVSASLAYNDSLSINNAAREGARLGGALDYSSDATAWANSVQTRVQQTYFNGASSLTTSQVCVQLVSDTGTVLATPTSQGTSCGTAPSSPSNMTPGSCAIKVWIQKPQSIYLAVFPVYNFSISAASVSFYGRTSGTCAAI